MTIYTRKGDDGTTSLSDNSRILKSDLRVSSYGDADELNSILGIVISSKLDADLKKILLRIQNELFVLGSDLSNPDMSDSKIRITQKMIDALESDIDMFSQEIPKLKNFILPGGTLGASFLHLARSICRRTERHVVDLSKNESLTPFIIPYLNRLSDLFFTMSRVINFRSKHSDIEWKSD